MGTGPGLSNLSGLRKRPLRCAARRLDKVLGFKPWDQAS
jgi:hypothetical protein